MSHVRHSVLARLAVACLTGFLLAGCDQSETLERSTPTPSPTPAAAKKEVPVSKLGDRVTVHYHRRDNHYDGAEIWTWDVQGKHTPARNELTSVGRDDFGAIFQLDRTNYGDSDKIGFIARLGHNWDHKDGGDRFWTPALGNEVWLLSGKNEMLTQHPDLSPQVESAYLDGPTAITLTLTEPAPSQVRVTLLDQQNVAHPVRSVAPGTAATPLKLLVVPQESLDLAKNHYRIQVDGFGAAVALTPRGILDHGDMYFDGSAHLGAIYQPQSTTFRLFAPTAASVSLVLYDESTGGKGRVVQSLLPQPKGLWELTVNADLQGKFYVYLLDGPGLQPAREVLDPVCGQRGGQQHARTHHGLTPPRRVPARASRRRRTW